MTTTFSRALAVVAIAGCGHPASPGVGPSGTADPIATAPAADGPAISLERIERIARACLADRTDPPLAWATINFAHKGATWRVRVDEQPVAGTQPSYVDVVVDPAASTCDGRAIVSRPEPGDAGLDAVIAIATRCNAGRIDPDRTVVDYHRLATGDFDRGRFDVVFYEPGTAVTFPMPHYLVDFPAGTCKKVDEMF